MKEIDEAVETVKKPGRMEAGVYDVGTGNGAKISGRYS